MLVIVAVTASSYVIKWVMAWRELHTMCLQDFGSRTNFTIRIGRRCLHVYSQVNHPPFPFRVGHGIASEVNGVFIEWHWPEDVLLLERRRKEHDDRGALFGEDRHG